MRRAALALLWLVAGVAQAAQLGQIDADSAKIYRLPQGDAEIVTTVKKGDYLTVSNYPYEGYYKVRTTKGEVGFIDTNDIYVIRDPEVLRKVLHHNKQAPQIRRDEPQVDLPTKPDREGRLGIKGPIHASLYGGLTLFPWSEFQTATSVTNYTGSLDFGGEVHFPVSRDFTFGIRMDIMTKGFVIKDSGGSTTHNLSSGAIPLMLGFGWRATPADASSKFRVFVAAMGGVSFNTSFSSQDVTIASDNVTTYSALGIAALGKVEVAYMLSRALGLKLEGGYRFLRTTGAVTASPASASGNTYLQSGGSTITMILNYSGFEVGGGAVFYF